MDFDKTMSFNFEKEKNEKAKETSKEVYEVLRKFLVKYKWIYFLNSRIFSKIRMKDVRDFIAVIEKVDK